MKHLKVNIIDYLLEQIDDKLNTLHLALLSAKESRNSDTKSSAGDKYETGRAMIQMEIEKNEIQMDKTLKLKHDLSQINYQCNYTKVEFGSFVETNRGIYFISIPQGKVTVATIDVYCISLASPIAQAMAGKGIRESFVFQNNIFEINDIV